MNDDLVQALDRLRESVDSLRVTIQETAKPGGRKYLDELQALHDEGLFDEATLAAKKRDFLDKL